MRSRIGKVVLVGVLFGAVARAADVDASYQKDYKIWQAQLTEDLKKNWLTLVGLFWLKDGTNKVGSDQNDDVPLPKARAASQVGVIAFHDGKAAFTTIGDVKITTDGRPVKSIELLPDVSGKPTVLQLGDLKMLMIQRGQKYGMRIRDVHSDGLKDFKGLDFYPVNGNFIVEAKFIPETTAKKVPIPTVLGQDAEMDSAGYVEFTINGQKERLHALSEGGDELFFIIKDPTAGKGTYPAGRFLYAALPKDGKVILDFNRAHNPPCAWTPYATCPLPPKENYLSVKVEAGEKYSGHH
jgi:hypothetical protein